MTDTPTPAPAPASDDLVKQIEWREARPVDASTWNNRIEVSFVFMTASERNALIARIHGDARVSAWAKARIAELEAQLAERDKAFDRVSQHVDAVNSAEEQLDEAAGEDELDGELPELFAESLGNLHSAIASLVLRRDKEVRRRTPPALLADGEA